MVSGLNVLLVTHDDLDGAGCEIITKAIFPNVITSRTSYSQLNKIMSKLATTSLDNTLLIMGDIMLKPEYEEMMDKIINKVTYFVYADHHQNGEWINKYAVHDYCFILHDTKQCGTSLLSTTLTAFCLVNKELIDPAHVITSQYEYRPFVNLVNDYDLWKHNYIESKELNRLLSFIGTDAFVDRFLCKSDPTFTSKELDLLIGIQKDLDNYINQAMDRVIIKDGIGYLYASRFISETGDALNQRLGLKATILVNFETGQVSVRSPIGIALAIAASFGGGGHANSAGFPIAKVIWVGNPIDIFTDIIAERNQKNAV